MKNGAALDLDKFLKIRNRCFQRGLDEGLQIGKIEIIEGEYNPSKEVFQQHTSFIVIARQDL